MIRSIATIALGLLSITYGIVFFIHETDTSAILSAIYFVGTVICGLLYYENRNKKR